MDARLTEEQEFLRASAREVLARECPSSLVRAMAADPLGCPDALWQRMGELGWTGLAVPERLGGAGLGPCELGVLLEEMGRVLLPGPFFSSAVLGSGALLLGGTDAQRGALLPALARGRLRVTLAVLEEEERWDADGVRLPARRKGSDLVLTGTKRFVLDARGADRLVVAARGEEDGALRLLLVDPRAPGVRIEPVALVDATRKAARVHLEGVAVAPDAVLDADAGTLERVLDRARVALCAEMLGSAARVLETSAAYARQREQFGRPIGSFQAIQHRLADMLVALEAARSATGYAAWAIATDEPDAALRAAMAKACTSEACTRIAEGGIQIHGGQGFTWEQDLHLHYRRAVVSARLFGDPAWCLEEVARRAIDGAA